MFPMTIDELRALIYLLQSPAAYAGKLAVALLPACWLLLAKSPRFAGLALVNCLAALEDIPSVIRVWMAFVRGEFPTGLTWLGS